LSLPRLQTPCHGLAFEIDLLNGRQYSDGQQLMSTLCPNS
jgi:hypothetical protein